MNELQIIEIHDARTAHLAQAALMLGTGLPVLALGVSRLLDGRGELASLLMAPVGLFLALAGAFALRRAMVRAVQVVLGPEGIEDRRTGQGLIPWGRIVSAEFVSQVRGQGSIRFDFTPERPGRLVVDVVPLEDGVARIDAGLRRFAPGVKRLRF